MRNIFTLRLSDLEKEELERISREEKEPVSRIIRESIDRYLAVRRFKRLRKKTLPFAEAQGLLTDEDVFKALGE